MRTINEQIQWLADHPELTEDALRAEVDKYVGITVQVSTPLDEWTEHNHNYGTWCHRYLKDGGVRIVSAAPAAECPDVCRCGEPIPHSDDPACSEHNNSAEYDEAIEVSE